MLNNNSCVTESGRCQTKSNPGRDALVRTKEWLETWFSLFSWNQTRWPRLLSASRDARTGMQVTASFTWSLCLWHSRQWCACVVFSGYSKSCSCQCHLDSKKATRDNWLQTWLFDLPNHNTKNCSVLWFSFPDAHYSVINHRKSANLGVEG